MNLFRRFVVWIIGSIVGLICWVGIQLLKGSDPGDLRKTDRIPEQVWEGGAGTMTVQIALSDPGELGIVFHRGKQTLEALQLLPPGDHRFAVDVPVGTGAVLQGRLREFGPASTLSVSVRCGDREVWSDTRAVDPASGAAPGLRLFCELEDAATGKRTED